MTLEADSLRIVVKIGSALIANGDGGLLRDKIAEYAQVVAAARSAGHQVVLVSSGAGAAGFGPLGYKQRPRSIIAKQASAAVGQGILIEAYARAFQEFDTVVGQILLTRNDFSSRDSYQNALNTFEALLDRGIVPIVNENDTVAIDELTFGENDMLSALVATLLHADMLVILTDTDGVYDRDPRKHDDAIRLERVDSISEELLAGSGGAGSDAGTGGMFAKLKAAEVALSLGVPVFIGRCDQTSSLDQIAKGKGNGTYFDLPLNKRVTRKEQWIGLHSEAMGRIWIDSGAEEALLRGGKSLLPVGVTEQSGGFANGDVVEIVSADGSLLGRGVVNYSAAQLERVLGRSTEVAKSELGVTKVEVVHRDNWVPLRSEDA